MMFSLRTTRWGGAGRRSWLAEKGKPSHDALAFATIPFGIGQQDRPIYGSFGLTGVSSWKRTARLTLQYSSVDSSFTGVFCLCAVFCLYSLCVWNESCNIRLSSDQLAIQCITQGASYCGKRWSGHPKKAKDSTVPMSFSKAGSWIALRSCLLRSI